MSLDVSSKTPPPPPPPQMDSCAREGSPSNSGAGSSCVVVGPQTKEVYYAAECLFMLSRGVRDGAEAGVSSATSSGAATAPKASEEWPCSVCGKVLPSYQALGGHKTKHRQPATGIRDGAEAGISSATSSGAATALETSKEWQCSVCGKVLPSFQALGGHKTKHRQPATPSASVAAPSGGRAPAVKVKVHQCEVCFRTFPSGQALGGHKGLHFERDKAGGVNGKEPAVKAKPVAAAVLRDFDLNLPVPVVQIEDKAAIASPKAKRARTLPVV